MDIGIDLGTTHSVVAVKGQVELVDGYPPGWYLEEYDVTIIPSPDGTLTFPSVLWANPDDRDDVLVGYEAKQKAEEGDSPIMFAKRVMGTDETLIVSGHEFTAIEVSGHILRYLKRSAQEALGKPIDRAIVTHPAYFGQSQIKATREAAELAGIDVSQPEQVMMEPVAAAIAYLVGVEEDPLTVMTYDLGGGTFDVTVLERLDGVVTMKSYDGNPLLGGYNFDRALVKWMYDKAEQRGKKIPYDPKNPEDRGRWARLLTIAERAKIRLSEAMTDRVKVPVRAPDVLVDESGAVVPIQESITRAEFREIISDYLDETIERCNAALAKAELEPEELDRILLVGGSTFGPWVTRALQEAFPDVRVEGFHPDTSVAIGAAIQAANLPALTAGHGLRLALEVPARSTSPFAIVAGAISAEDGSHLDDELREGLSLYLAQDGTIGDPVMLEPGGRFVFPRVELEDDDGTHFELRVVDSEGLDRLVEAFTVEYDPDGKGERVDIYSVLPKQISVQTARGLVPLAEEGVPLPAKITEKYERLHDDPTLAIDVFVEGEPVGKIVIDDIPDAAGKGSTVHLEVQVTERNEMRGTARVVTRGKTEVAKREIRIDFPPAKLPSAVELLTQFEDLEGQREEAEAMTADPRHRTQLAGKGKKLSRRLERLFQEKDPDRQEIQQALRELDRIVHPKTHDMEPSMASFLDRFEACHDAIIAMGEDPKARAMGKSLERIRVDADSAYATKNHKRWARANENLSALYGKTQREKETGPPPELPPTDLLKDQALLELDQHRAKLDDKRDRVSARPDYESRLRERCDRVEQRIDAMVRAVQSVDDDLPPQRGYSKIRQATRGMERLPKEINDVEWNIE